jgi:hypothetical protein
MTHQQSEDRGAHQPVFGDDVDPQQRRIAIGSAADDEAGLDIASCCIDYQYH